MSIIIPYQYLSLLIPVFFLYTCQKRPDYPVAPSIELVEATRTKIEDPSSASQDSISIHLKYKDGDGDLGMDATDEPLNEFSYSIDPVKKDTVKIPGPYSIANCATQFKNNVNGKIYSITRNPNYFNLIVTIYKKNNDNTYSQFSLPGCVSYNGRFTRFNSDNSYTGPIDGNIVIAIPTDLKSYLTPVSKVPTVYFEIYIKDRAFHKSNTVRTPDFVLN